MKKSYLIPILALLSVAGILGAAYFLSQRAKAAGGFETEPIQRGNLLEVVGADGTVRSQQSAILSWKTSGTVAPFLTQTGEQVAAGQVLARLDPGSLAPNVILAQADLVSAQRALDNLQQSQDQQAHAQQAVEQARNALEDARDPQVAQAAAQTNLAAAQKTADDARLQYELLTTPPSAEAINQARSTLLLAENILKQTQDNIDKINKRLTKPNSKYKFYESRDVYENILDSLEKKKVNDQRTYDKVLARYNNLLAPPDPDDLSLAQTALAAAEAQLAQAQTEWERVKDGPDPANIALLQARLADAERERSRLLKGPDPADVLAAQARVAAAQAVLSQEQISAPFAGVITKEQVKPGDQVKPGSPAFRLDDLSRILVDGLVSEIDINKILVGQPVTLTLESIPVQIAAPAADGAQVGQLLKKTYQGEVLEKQQIGQTVNGVTQYQVTIALTDPDQLIKPGMSAHAHIFANDLKDVLLVPNKAIRYRDGQKVVYIQKGDQLVPIVITTGTASDSLSEVLSGELQEGDLVVTNPPSLQAGISN